MICAVIATRHHPPALSRLLGILAADEICTHLVVDAHASQRHLYRLWNSGCDAARAHGATSIAVLHDDIAILPGSLPLLASVLEADPRLGVVHPDSAAQHWRLPIDPPLVDRKRLMTGDCFMFRAAAGVRFDVTLPFWFVDQQFDRDLRAAGWTVGCLLGVPYQPGPMAGRGGAATTAA